MFADMPLGLAMHNKWDNINMTAPLHSLRMERPAYSTPAPVENTPSNNECRMVELRGAKIASFIVGGDEYICLPQAFDLFLKHLVGGLHTVYTKLKRLSIAPVVCNVEQVRILRGIGAIQPGVNRCKLITRKDFETLYQDCTTATRPGRPPKRYPMLPPTSDYMSSHSSVRNGSGAHGLMNSTDFSSLHKRMRMDNVEKQMHAFHDHRRASCSPPNGNDGMNAEKDMGLGNSSDLHNNATNFFLQAQALRQQYQQAASGLHNGLDAQHAAAAAAGINPALAPFMMMSHPTLFSGGLPPSSLSMINHVNQLAQGHNAASMTSAAAAAVAQIANRSGGNYQVAAAQAAAQVAASFAAAQEVNDTNRQSGSEPAIEERDSDVELKQSSQTTSAIMTNGIGSDGRASPESSLSDGSASHLSEHSETALSLKSDSEESAREASKVENNDDNLGVNSHEYGGSVETSNVHGHTNEGDESFEEQFLQQSASTDAAFSLHSMNNPNNQSSMQTLLTNIQGLLKVAADNARLQEKHKSFEIAELKMRLNKERQMREELEKKIKHISKSRDEAIKKYKKEIKSRKYAQEQYTSFKTKYPKEIAEKDVSGTTSPPPPSDGDSIKSVGNDVTSSPTTNKQYSHGGSPVPPTQTPNIAGSVTSIERENIEPRLSPITKFQSTSAPSYVGENTNNNNRSTLTSSRSSLDQSSDGAHSRIPSSRESPCAVGMETHDRRTSDHMPLSDERYSMMCY